MTPAREIYITGPTACGKTARAVGLAQAIGGEIVSADSRQVFRNMDIGTGKDIEEYGSVPYHLIDILPAGAHYNLFGFLRDARAAIADINRRGRTAIICGGTGMYVEALLRGTVLPEVPRNEELRTQLRGKSLAELTAILAGMKSLHNTTDTDTVARAIRAIEIQSYYDEHPDQAERLSPTEGMRHPQPPIVVLDIPRDERRQRISQRLQSRLDQGMIDEVRSLLANGVDPDVLIGYGLEYRFVTRYLLGETDFEEMRTGLETAIHQFAKRQLTWFRGMERRGCQLTWLRYNMAQEDFNRQVMQLCADC